ncbi:unnamed protein product [Dracunculus medinensis]|uniref:Secreted protein n=1 Tax=Dracunculus medinensis TaxID=318479 RepID=A0A0N4URU6_DRAME|nr:unnamed protein product [Dracunculus medinensis]
MVMLTFFLLLSSLSNHANGGAVEIDVCHMLVPVPQQGAGPGVGVGPGAAAQPGSVRRPTVPVESCQDRDAPACSEIFKYEAGEIRVLADNLLP